MKKKRKSINFIHKLKSVRKEIKFIFLISLSSVLLIEIVFKNYNAPYHSFYVIGDIYLKICYSIVATSIFFLINQHIPKENRNVKTNKFIHNKLVTVFNELSWLSERLDIDKKNLDITEEMVKLACEKINPNSPVVEFQINIFSNWREYLIYKTNKINRLLSDVMTLNSSIETELLGHIVNMLDALDQFYYLDNKNMGLGKDLTFYSRPISNLYEENYKLHKILSSGKYKIYLNTNMNDFLKNRNTKK
ncbi:hypothetical protein LPB87_10050 [Flavobacterium sp. EDS]|uniref:hypothetical protein n=1 Tax=Flavobacterium sp. EDS TaxID=2897328 RepID=UPI001E4BB8FA|nr:hypothetical protein [Flavobacterium sp. EDS]MCD0474731.1 hypothetical protein [Flavobacterium sp. EDS]